MHCVRARVHELISPRPARRTGARGTGSRRRERQVRRACRVLPFVASTGCCPAPRRSSERGDGGGRSGRRRIADRTGPAAAISRPFGQAVTARARPRSGFVPATGVDRREAEPARRRRRAPLGRGTLAGPRRGQHHQVELLAKPAPRPSVSGSIRSGRPMSASAARERRTMASARYVVPVRAGSGRARERRAAGTRSAKKSPPTAVPRPPDRPRRALRYRLGGDVPQVEHDAAQVRCAARRTRRSGPSPPPTSATVAGGSAQAVLGASGGARPAPAAIAR